MSAEIFDQAALEKAGKILMSPLKFRAFTVKDLPLAAAAGISVDHIDDNVCKVGMPGGWRTQNPFKSTYWAAQGMAAEAASGMLPFIYCEAAPEKVNMILGSCDAKFTRQCVGRSVFVCEAGHQVRDAIASTIETGKRVWCETKVQGFDSEGEQVSEWTFTWSFKVSRKKSA